MPNLEKEQARLKGGLKAVRQWFRHNIVILVLVLLLAGALGYIAWKYTSNVKKSIEYEEMKTELAETKKQRDQNAKELEQTSAKLKKTEEELSYANDQVELLNDSTAALKRQVTGQKENIAKLQNRIKELLHIIENEEVTRSQLEEQINSIGELATLKYIYTNSSRKTGNLTWLWGWTVPFSDSSLLVTYDGTIKAGINLSEIKFAVNDSSRAITVTLPKSKVLDHNIPQETINVLEVKDGLFNPITFDDYNKFIAEEKKVMEQKAISIGVLTDADKEAKAIIEAFLKAIPGMDSYTLTFK